MATSDCKNDPTSRTAAMLMEAAHEFGLSMRQWSILACIAERPGLSSKDIAARLGLLKSIVSHGLDRLVALGLVERTGHELDHRFLRLTLTAPGRAVVRRVAEAKLTVSVSVGAAPASQVSIRSERFSGSALMKEHAVRQQLARALYIHSVHDPCCLLFGPGNLDFPGQHLVRIMLTIPEDTFTDYCWTADSLERAQEMVPAGLTLLPKELTDARPGLLEQWCLKRYEPHRFRRRLVGSSHVAMAGASSRAYGHRSAL